jgi:hypothetical protein
LFVKFHLLKPGNRLPFSKADSSILTVIDLERGKDEIPLFDPQTQQTLYGIDSLLEILDQKIPCVKRIGHLKPVNWFLRKLYKLISYNRKVIIARQCAPGSFDCSPAYNAFYRLMFLAVFLLFNSLMLIPLHQHVFSKLSFYHLDSWQLQSGHLVFVGINCLMALSLGRRMAIEYLGQVNMLALVCILFLLVLFFITSILPVPEWMVACYLALLTIFIFKEYFRRMAYVGILRFHKPITVVNIVCLLIYLIYVFH